MCMRDSMRELQEPESLLTSSREKWCRPPHLCRVVTNYGRQDQAHRTNRSKHNSDISISPLRFKGSCLPEVLNLCTTTQRVNQTWISSNDRNLMDVSGAYHGCLIASRGTVAFQETLDILPHARVLYVGFNLRSQTEQQCVPFEWGLYVLQNTFMIQKHISKVTMSL